MSLFARYTQRSLCLFLLFAVSLPLVAQSSTANITDPNTDAEYQDYLNFKKYKKWSQAHSQGMNTDESTPFSIGVRSVKVSPFSVVGGGGYQSLTHSVLGGDPSGLLGLKLGVNYRVPLSAKITLIPGLSYIRKGNKESAGDSAGSLITLENQVDEVQIELDTEVKVFPWLNVIISPYVAYVLSDNIYYNDSKIGDINSYTNRVEYGASAGLGTAWDTDGGQYRLSLMFSQGLSNLYKDSIVSFGGSKSAKTSGIGFQLAWAIKH